MYEQNFAIPEHDTWQSMVNPSIRSVNTINGSVAIQTVTPDVQNRISLWSLKTSLFSLNRIRNVFRDHHSANFYATKSDFVVCLNLNINNELVFGKKVATSIMTGGEEDIRLHVADLTSRQETSSFSLVGFASEVKLKDAGEFQDHLYDHLDSASNPNLVTSSNVSLPPLGVGLYGANIESRNRHRVVRLDFLNDEDWILKKELSPDEYSYAQFSYITPSGDVGTVSGISSTIEDLNPGKSPVLGIQSIKVPKSIRNDPCFNVATINDVSYTTSKGGLHVYECESLYKRVMRTVAAENHRFCSASYIQTIMAPVYSKDVFSAFLRDSKTCVVNATHDYAAAFFRADICGINLKTEIVGTKVSKFLGTGVKHSVGVGARVGVVDIDASMTRAEIQQFVAQQINLQVQTAQVQIVQAFTAMEQRVTRLVREEVGLRMGGVGVDARAMVLHA